MNAGAIARYLVASLLLSGGIALLSTLALAAQPGTQVSIVYAVTGIGVAILWGFGLRWMPAVWLSHFLVSWRASNSLWIAAYVAMVEILATMVLLLLLNRSRVSQQFGRLRDLGWFSLWALFSTALGGALGAAGEAVFDPQAPAQLLADGLSFWISDFVSILVFVPLILTWREKPFPTGKVAKQWVLLSLALALFGAAIVAFETSSATGLFLLLPFVVFSAIIGGVAGAAGTGLILLMILLGLSAVGARASFEPIVRAGFVATCTATGYVLAIVWTERERVARRLRHLARHDALTGTYNRYELEALLRQELRGGEPSSHALLYLDLDQFKLVNDTCGHVAGDRMLQELAQELRGAVPADASIARLGGDEFACVLPATSVERAVDVAESILETTAQYRFPYNSLSFGTSVSIGITSFPSAAGDTPDSVLGRADIACYMAKENGRNRAHVYLPGDEAMLQLHASMQEVSQLEVAMENGRFRLYEQAVVDISDDARAISFHEVLLRFEHEGEVKAAGAFLPLAQRFGLMERIDRWVIERTCEYLATRGDDTRLSVNVYGSTLNQPSFYQFVSALPARFGIRPAQLCLEVTEDVMIHRLRQAVASMARLREQGYDIALDDFGAGVASFAYLQELPVTHVKLDGRFVRELGRDPSSDLIVESLVKLARIRNIECVAEWAESAESVERLRDLGVRYAQGFYLSVPQPLGTSHGSPAQIPLDPVVGETA